MHSFASNTWTEEDSQRKRERVAGLSDAELQRELESAEYLCSPRAYWGKGPRQSYIIQREIVRGERRRRAGREMLLRSCV